MIDIIPQEHIDRLRFLRNKGKLNNLQQDELKAREKLQNKFVNTGKFDFKHNEDLKTIEDRVDGLRLVFSEKAGKLVVIEEGGEINGE